MAKLPDIVLMLVDASIGFEMQTFEFLSMLQIHGFPKCIAVATHLDFYDKQNKKMRNAVKLLKKRLEVEVTQETKLFTIRDLKNNYYCYRDVANLARFLSIINPREMPFKELHPHILVDRYD